MLKISGLCSDENYFETPITTAKPGRFNAKPSSCFQICHGQGIVREKQKTFPCQGKVREFIADALHTEAETENKMDFLVKSNVMLRFPLKHKDIENEEKAIDGLQKMLRLM